MVTGCFACKCYTENQFARSCTIRDSKLGRRPWKCYTELLDKCGIVPINVVLELNQQPDYAKSVDDEVDTALAELMSRMGCSHSVEEFVEMDDDEQTTEEVVVAVEYPAQVNDESESDEELVISASEALSCCLQLQSYLVCTDDSDDWAKHIAQITLLRGHCQDRKKQVPITSYFNVV